MLSNNLSDNNKCAVATLYHSQATAVILQIFYEFCELFIGFHGESP